MIKYWLSDYELEEQLIDLIKRREIDQKFLYFWEWAEIYYKAYWFGNKEEDDNTDLYWLKEASVWASKWAYDFIKDNILDKESWKKWVIISLGCWNWFQETEILNKINLDKSNLSYIWVDSSKSMLSLVKKNLKDISTHKTFICADFTSSQFVNEIHEITSDYDYRIFCFLWYTFWNTNQTSMTDSLYAILWPNDYLLLDALTRKDDTPNTKLRLFERYSSYLENSLMKDFWFATFEDIWVPKKKWRMTLKTENEESVWAFVFKFIYEFTDKIKLNIRGKAIHILPWESIDLYSIRNYDYGKLINFFDEHEFEIIDSNRNGFESYISSVRLLFKRK